MKQLFHFIPALVAVLLFTGCSGSAPTTESRLRLGTSVTVTMHDSVPRGTFASIWNRLEDIESKMSINNDRWQNTELMEVNLSAGEQPVAVSDETMYVLQAGLKIGELSDGAFDVTIAPLVLLWMTTSDQPQIPSEAAVQEATRLVDYSKVEIHDNAVFLPKPGMGIDLGGVAKGYAAAEAARLIKAAGINHAILDFGGDVIAVGTRPDGDPWRIGLQNPQQRRGSLMGVVEVTDTSIVTSGVYERYFMQDGVRYHHIFDPATGYPAWNELISVTVVAKDATVADALSTAAFVMGLEDGLALIEQLPETEGIFIDEQNMVFVSTGLQERFRLLSDDFTIASSQNETHDDTAGVTFP